MPSCMIRACIIVLVVQLSDSFSWSLLTQYSLRQLKWGDSIEGLLVAGKFQH